MYNLLFGHRETIDPDDREIPDEFKCPITLDIMDHPVIDPEGNSYEREYIIKYLQGQEETGIEPSSPLTRTPLKISDLKENKELKDKIIKFKAVQDMPNIPNIPNTDTNLNYQKLKEGGSDGSANKISNMLSSFGGFWGAEPEPEVQDMVTGGASGVEHPRNYTNGWVIFVGASAFPGQNTRELTMEGPNHSRATIICMEHELRGYMWARGNHYFTPTLPRRVTSDEYLMDITDQHPEGEPGNRHDAEKNRDEVHLAPGASLNLLAMKIIELKSLDHTRSIKLEIYIEDQGDYYELIHMNPELKGLIKMRKSVRRVAGAGVGGAAARTFKKKSRSGRGYSDPALADVPYDPSLCSKRIWNGGLGAQCQSAKMGGDSSSEFCTRCTKEFGNKGALPFGYYDQEKPEFDLVTGKAIPWKKPGESNDFFSNPSMKVSEIREMLEERGLDSSGKKNEIKERLDAYLKAEEQQDQEDQEDQEVIHESPLEDFKDTEKNPKMKGRSKYKNKKKRKTNRKTRKTRKSRKTRRTQRTRRTRRKQMGKISFK